MENILRIREFLNGIRELQLPRLLRDGRIELDTNTVERAIRQTSSKQPLKDACIRARPSCPAASILSVFVIWTPIGAGNLGRSASTRFAVNRKEACFRRHTMGGPFLIGGAAHQN
jgi:hypothetical protein